MNDSLKGFIISFLLIGLFSFALFKFAYQIGIDNDQPKFLENKWVNMTTWENTLNSTQESYESQREGFEKETITSTVGDLIFGGIWESGKLMVSGTVGIFNVIFMTLANLLGIPEIVLAVLTSILLLTGILLLWKLVKVGE